MPATGSSSLSETGWDKVLNVNVKGAFLLTQALLPQLKSASTPDDPARVINIGTIDGIRPPPSFRLTAASAPPVDLLTEPQKKDEILCLPKRYPLRQ